MAGKSDGREKATHTLTWSQVTVEVRKIRRRPETPLDADMTVPISESLPAEAIGHAKLLTVRQFYYIFCFLTGTSESDALCGCVLVCQLTVEYVDVRYQVVCSPHCAVP